MRAVLLSGPGRAPREAATGHPTSRQVAPHGPYRAPMRAVLLTTR
ncbi:hypothetical protein [Streptomyces sp. NPDC048637]